MSSDMGWPPINLDTCEAMVSAYLSQVRDVSQPDSVRGSRALAIIGAVRRLVGRCRVAEARGARVEAENARLREFYAVADSYLARGGDAADYLPLDLLAAWQRVDAPEVRSE